MSDENYVPIYTTRNIAKLEIIKAALEGEGIPCRIDNEHQAAMTGVTEAQLLVLEHDQDAAVDFINQHDEGEETTAPD